MPRVETKDEALTVIADYTSKHGDSTLRACLLVVGCKLIESISLIPAIDKARRELVSIEDSNNVYERYDGRYRSSISSTNHEIRHLLCHFPERRVAHFGQHELPELLERSAQAKR